MGIFDISTIFTYSQEVGCKNGNVATAKFRKTKHVQAAVVGGRFKHNAKNTMRRQNYDDCVFWDDMMKDDRRLLLN